MKQVAVLFAMERSIYNSFPEADVFDKERNALTFTGGLPIVAHPPCRAWGRLRKNANPEPGEKELAIWAVEQVRTNGGVLEHPEASLLWREMNLPLLGKDEFGGFTISVDQFWWGHRARKRTWLYIVGCGMGDLPPQAIRFDCVQHTVVRDSKRGKRNKKEIGKRELSATPPEFAKWLIEVAKICKK